MNAEQNRLLESTLHHRHWKRWGPYLAERAWGTVREDYSGEATPWEYFPHDQARSRAYRWNEDGLAGICDRHQYLCFALALWNERDPILKERMFGLTGHEGNHGEDVKEYYFYLDSTPTHSYMKYLYKYPQAAFPYAQLVQENRQRTKHDPEYELLDTGIFGDDRYFDVYVEYAKASVEDIRIRISVINRGPDPAPLHVLPTVWFRNTWAWNPEEAKPTLRWSPTHGSSGAIEIAHPVLGRRLLFSGDATDMLFTENETNYRALFKAPSRAPYVKDGVNDYLVNGVRTAVNPAKEGTKAAAHWALVVQPGATAVVRLRLTDSPRGPDPTDEGSDFDAVLETRRQEADEFYDAIIPRELSSDARSVVRQAFAGLLWSKQFYHYIVRDWLRGDPGYPPPRPERLHGRNHEWTHLYAADVISMPDKWEYPWYASWDLAFQCVALAPVDPDFAKDQLVLLLREWYMHPNGQLPAYEWAFGDVNPPVHAWAAWRVYRIEQERTGRGDRQFLERVFHKLLLNFTWWVNREDAEGLNLFQGGFLGFDNIGVFDRSQRLPTGGHLEQSDATSWMAMFSLNLLAIAMELAREDPAFEDVASKFWEHFLYIAHAMTRRGESGLELWDEEDGFFYDVIHMDDGRCVPLKVRSMVGLIPLFAVQTLESDDLQRLPGFKRRLDWFIEHRPDLTAHVARMDLPGHRAGRLLAIVDGDRLRRVLAVMLDEREFLSPYGIRALSRVHLEKPFLFRIDGHVHEVRYEPAESVTDQFGGNSNWRGPIWFPVNYLIIEALQRFHHYFGDGFRVECPTGSGQRLTLGEVACEISNRLGRLFLRGADGRRPACGGVDEFQRDPHWCDLVPFSECFNGDTGAGLGASHQTGWTGLVAFLMRESGPACAVATGRAFRGAAGPAPPATGPGAGDGGPALKPAAGRYAAHHPGSSRWRPRLV